MKWVELPHTAQKSYILLNVLRRKEREELLDWSVSSSSISSLMHQLLTTTS